MEEIEIKFLNIDVPETEKKLLDIGAEKVGEYFYHRRHFDYPGEPLDKKGEWIRVRDEGDKVTMAHKKFLNYDRNVKVAKDVIVEEREVDVSDFDKACEMLFAIGFVEKNYQENKRIRYKKGEIEYDIDFWPKIPPLLEIEGPELGLVQDAATQLGFDLSNAVRYTGWQIYNDYGINLHDFKRVTFDEWIEK
jgi:adenylate cyclase class 2